MFEKGMTVWNTITGAQATVRGVWYNEFSGRTVVNVLPDGAAKADWQMWDAENVTSAFVTVAVFDEVVITTDGTDEMFATVLDVQGERLFVHLDDYDGEYVPVDISHVVRNLTTEAKTEKAA